MTLLTEWSDISGGMTAPGMTIETVTATDGDTDVESNPPAGQIEYVILTGNTLGGVVVFGIPNPMVSDRHTVVATNSMYTFTCVCRFYSFKRLYNYRNNFVLLPLFVLPLSLSGLL